MVIGEADRRDRQLRHQTVADVDVVVPSQDQVQNIAADVGCRFWICSFAQYVDYRRCAILSVSDRLIANRLPEIFHSFCLKVDFV